MSVSYVKSEGVIKKEYTLFVLSMDYSVNPKAFNSLFNLDSPAIGLVS